MLIVAFHVLIQIVFASQTDGEEDQVATTAQPTYYYSESDAEGRRHSWGRDMKKKFSKFKKSRKNKSEEKRERKGSTSSLDSNFKGFFSKFKIGKKKGKEPREKAKETEGHESQVESDEYEEPSSYAPGTPEEQIFLDYQSAVIGAENANRWLTNEDKNFMFDREVDL